MAVLNDCELFYVKCDPARPNKAFDADRPSWEVQLRTTSPAKKDEWIAVGFKPKLIVHKEGADEGMPVLDEAGNRQWRLNLNKKSITREGKASAPVEVVNGALQPIDPNTVGNGSIGNVRVYQYERQDKTGLASVLMGIQVTRHIIYTPKVRDDDFKTADYETVAPAVEGTTSTDTGFAPVNSTGTTVPVAPGVTKVADARPDIAF